MVSHLLLRLWVYSQRAEGWRRQGGEGGHAPRAVMCRGRHFWNLNLNSEIWPLLTNWRLHYRQWYFTPLTLPSFGTTPLNCQCTTTPHTAVCTVRNLHWWSLWSFTCCKTVEDPYCSVTVLLAIAIQCFTLLRRFQSLQKLEILHGIWSKIFKFVATKC